MNSKSDPTDSSLTANGMIVAIGAPEILASTFRQIGVPVSDISCNDSPGSSASVWIAPSAPDLTLYSLAEKGDWLVAVFGYFYCELHGLAENVGWTQIETEVIADRLGHEGPDFLHNLDGAYFLVVLNKSSGEIYAKADPGGTRRLFQYSDSDICILSNKLDLISRVSSRSENAVARNFYLVYGYHPLDHTPYNDVKRLPGANIFRFSGQEMQVWSPSTSSSSSGSAATDFESALTQLYSALKLSLEAQLHGNKRVAVLLGGFDSSLVASLAKRMGLEVETFSFYYDDQSFNQAHTDTLADYLGIKHNWIHITKDMVSKGLQRYNELFDQPTNWANYPIQTAFLAKEIKKRGFEVILTGDGCDGAFYGYPGVYKSYKIVNRRWRLPRFITQALTRAIAALRVEELGGHPVRVLLRILRVMEIEYPERIFFMYRFMDETSIGKLIGIKAGSIEREVKALEEEISSCIPNVSGPALAYMGRNVAAPSRTKLAGASDFSDLPIFSPYMHPFVGAVIRSFPDQWLRPEHGEFSDSQLGKYILVRMTQQYELLPDSIIFQRKLAAVDGPVDAWYQNELRSQIEAMLDRLPFPYTKSYIHNLLRPKWSESVYSKHFSSDSLTSHALMLLVTYATYFSERQ